MAKAQIMRTFVCPGRWDEKTKQTVEMHGGWWNTKETDKCPTCGKEALTREDANVTVAYQWKPLTWTEYEEKYG